MFHFRISFSLALQTKYLIHKHPPPTHPNNSNDLYKLVFVLNLHFYFQNYLGKCNCPKCVLLRSTIVRVCYNFSEETVILRYVQILRKVNGFGIRFFFLLTESHVELPHFVSFIPSFLLFTVTEDIQELQC